jgi:CheY-like chemotaxis protein
MAKKYQVLIVDDEADKRNLLAFALQREGYEVRTAFDGEAGLRAVEEHQPDLIITDTMMPGMDGYEMTRRLRSNPRTRFIPVIIQSAARVRGQDIRLGSEVGALGYLTDPTDLDLLRARARTLLEFKRYLDDMEETSAAALRERRKLAEAREREVRRKKAAGVFDVFLCHNNKDRERVKEIALELERRGITPWLDEWELRPGLPWQEALEQQTSRIKSAAVFVGDKGIGPWQKQEIDAFLREFIARGCPVIPVLLHNAPQEPKLLPNFLEGMTWVDFRKNDPDPMEQLCWGIRGSYQPEAEEEGQASPDVVDADNEEGQDVAWEAHVALHKIFEETGGDVWMPDIGSEGHKLAENMVRRGLLARGPAGVGYTLPGRLFSDKKGG